MRVLVYTILFLSSGSILAQNANELNNGNTNSTPIYTNNSNVAPNNIILEEVEEVEEVEFDTTIVVPSAPASKISSESMNKKGIQKVEAKGKSKGSKRFKAVPIQEAEPRDVRDLLDDTELEVESISSNSANISHEKQMEMEGYSVGFTVSKSSSDTQRTSRSPSMQQQVQMDKVVDYYEVNAPSSFEANYFKYAAGNYNVDLYPNLKAAERFRPENADVHVQMAGYFMIEDDVDSALIYVEKLRESDRLTENVVDYSSDILRSVPEDGALITHGFDDGYGSFYAQNSASRIRPDVTLISLDFLQSDAYKKELKTKGFELPKSEVVDVDYLAEFCALNVDKNLSISLTTPKEYFQAIQDKLYVVGLVFEYHPESFDNFTRNDYLWNNSMEKGVITNPIDEKGKQLSANYLPMLLHLRKVYQVTGEKEKMKEVDEVSDEISVQCRKYEQVQKVKASY